MSQRYGTVHAKFWTDDKVRRWSDRDRLAALYLLTGPHGTIAGAMRLPLQYMAADLGWSVSDCQETVSRLSAEGFLTYDEGSNWCLVTRRLRYDPPQNPASLKGILKVLDEMPAQHPGWPTIHKVLQELSEKYKVPVPWQDDRFETVRGQSPDGVPHPQPTAAAADTANSQEVDTPAAAPAAPPEAKAGKPGQAYLFQGRVIRLIESDYRAWEVAYPMIDLRAELQSLDDWLASIASAAERKGWFALTSAALRKRNEARKTSPPRPADPKDVPKQTNNYSGAEYRAAGVDPVGQSHEETVRLMEEYRSRKRSGHASHAN